MNDSIDKFFIWMLAMAGLVLAMFGQAKIRDLNERIDVLEKKLSVASPFPPKP